VAHWKTVQVSYTIDVYKLPRWNALMVKRSLRLVLAYELGWSLEGVNWNFRKPMAENLNYGTLRPSLINIIWTQADSLNTQFWFFQTLLRWAASYIWRHTSSRKLIDINCLLRSFYGLLLTQVGLFSASISFHRAPDEFEHLRCVCYVASRSATQKLLLHCRCLYCCWLIDFRLLRQLT